ncbi:helicase-related protein [Nannocystaceae bacterium ST9]
MNGLAPAVGIVAALGPTNTGKTHRAVERMLEHRSGMIGLPLRLLAREIYDRVSARVGELRVALITGEEKRIPARPDYWVCTVEAMPLEREVDFLAVDEIQLAAHRQRGHVFTDRMLRARGRLETWFMGADTIRPVLEQLVPTAEITRRPRLSQLRGIGSLSLGALPPRTAVVAFSAEEVYSLAERLRRRRGGAAVVLGALSPRTRNAQVALYQAGEVDYLVATDAIGMGLNMDVDLVAFASLRKYDGEELRSLDAAELAQIAGRAGRAENDGSFCTLAAGHTQGVAPAMSDELIRAIEEHRFPEIRKVQWRNSELDFRSLATLIDSLKQRPPGRFAALVEPVRKADDFAALVQLAARPDVAALARGREAVELLWDVCQIPDFRKLLDYPDFGHVDLLANLYVQLASPRGRIDGEWMRERIDRLAKVDGDLHALLDRLATIRTWTYVSHHRKWIHDPEFWQARTRTIEDELSDALHERLMARFVEHGRARPAFPRHRKTARHRSVRERIEHERVAEGPFAKLLELELAPGPSEPDEPAAIDDDWLQAIIDAPHQHFALDDQGFVRAGEHRVARLGRGVDLLRPEVTVTLPEIGAGVRSRIARRLVAWTRDAVDELLAPLRRGPIDRLSSDARGLVYQLEQGLGTIHVEAAQAQLRRLSGRDRSELGKLGVKIGARMIWLPKLLSPAALRMRALLCSAALPRGVTLAIPRPGAVALVPEADVDPGAYTAIGFPVFGPRALRADIVERIHAELAKLEGEPEFELPVVIGSWTGVRREELVEVLAAFDVVEHDGGGYRLMRTTPGRARDRPSPSDARGGRTD